MNAREVLNQRKTIITFLEDKKIKHRTINGLAVNRDAIVNYYNTGEEAYQKLIDEIKQILNIRAFYCNRTDNWLWIEIIKE